MEQQVKVGAGVLIFRNGKTLLGKRKSKDAVATGEYGSVGGHLEYMETLEECVRRESLEECGLHLKNLRYLCTVNLRRYTPKHYIDIGFVADAEDGEPVVNEPDKCESFAWYDLDDLPSPLFGVLPQYFEALRTGKTFFEVE